MPPSNDTSNLSYFEKQRDLLISDISTSMEKVLNNLNSLNRSMEGCVAVGKEFDSVSVVWSKFYDGMTQMDKAKKRDEDEESGSPDE